MALDPVPILVRLHVFGAGLDRRLEHLIGSCLAHVEFDRAELIEHEGDGAGLAEITAEFGEDRTYLARRAIAIVGQGLDDEADAACAESLVANLLVIRAASLLALLDRALDIVLWHVLGARRLDRASEPRIHGGVPQGHLRRGGGFPGGPGGELGALCVLGALAGFDAFVLSMAAL